MFKVSRQKYIISRVILILGEALILVGNHRSCQEDANAAVWQASRGIVSCSVDGKQ
jgi:hypothetical protein